MRVKEAAGRLEVSQSTVYELCARGLLPHVRVGAGRGAIRINEDDLRAYLESCRAVKPPERRNLKGIRL
jgi:excisionase family DNA binding protein